MEQQRRALHELGVLGDLQAADLAIGRASPAIGDAQAEILSARNDAAHGHVDQAAMNLRRHADSNSRAADMLIEVLAETSRTAQALSECDRAIRPFRSGSISDP